MQLLDEFLPVGIRLFFERRLVFIPTGEGVVEKTVVEQGQLAVHDLESFGIYLDFSPVFPIA